MSHLKKPCDDDLWLRDLPAPVKNQFFYGMLLTEEILRKDQRYFDGKRWLLNRLGLGKGVLTGLDFAVSKDETKPGSREFRWHIRMDSGGVAVDGFGREIVVPPKSSCESYPESIVEIAIIDDEGEVKAHNVVEFLHRLNIRPEKVAETQQPDRDEEFPDGFELAQQQQPTKKPQKSTAILKLQISLHSIPTDPAPVKAGHCSHDCEASSIREGFQLRVVNIGGHDPRHWYISQSETKYSSAIREELSRDDPNWPSGGNLAHVFPEEPPEDVWHRGMAQETQQLVASELPAENAKWVTLGLIELTVTWDTPGLPSLAFSKLGRYYRQVFSNDALSRLVFGLADRVDEASRVRVLTFDKLPAGECQIGNVYQPLDKPLKVRVVDSHSDEPIDADSIQVRFDVVSGDHTGDSGILASSFDSSVAYDASQGQSWMQVDVKPDGTLSEDVYWRLHDVPGLHTVSARIVPQDPTDPSFHPGSQLIFHATAKPTAPTIVGIEFVDPWHVDKKCREYAWNRALIMRLMFSRQMNLDHFEQLEQNFRVWCVARHHHHGTIIGPRRLHFMKINSVHHEPPNDEVWQVECELSSLPSLCPEDTLRVALLGRVNAELSLFSSPSEHYPTPQLLDLSFDGSYLSKMYRDRLWYGDPYLDGDGEDGIVAKLASPAEENRDYPDHLDPETMGCLTRFWNRFRLREACLPTGDGREGGEFHKTFEFRLPCKC